MNGIDQIIDGKQAVFFCDIGYMGIAGCCIWICMAEKGLNMAET